MRKTPLFELLRVARPCEQDWDGMTPEDGGRHCASCQKSVHDVATLRTSDVEDLVRAMAGQEPPCIRLFVRRSDGAILVGDGHIRPPSAPADGACRKPVPLAVALAATALVACSAGPELSTKQPRALPTTSTATPSIAEPPTGSSAQPSVEEGARPFAGPTRLSVPTADSTEPGPIRIDGNGPVRVDATMSGSGGPLPTGQPKPSRATATKTATATAKPSKSNDGPKRVERSPAKAPDPEKYEMLLGVMEGGDAL